MLKLIQHDDCCRKCFFIKPMPISAVVLTKNEERNLKDCLDCLYWCDEIIVIDDNSTDKTVEIAVDQKAIVYQRPLNNDFASQRNFGLEKASNDWVFFIDADERICPKLVEEIETVICHSNKNEDLKCYQNIVKGFYIVRKDIFLGKLLKHGETGMIKFLRLGKKGAGVWKRKVHEYWDIKGITKTLKRQMAHYPHPSISLFLKDINYYSSLNAQVFFDEGVRVSKWQIVFYPLGKFFYNFFWKKGFLDGNIGFIHAVIMSFHSFLTRSKLYFLQNK